MNIEDRRIDRYIERDKTLVQGGQGTRGYVSKIDGSRYSTAEACRASVCEILAAHDPTCSMNLDELRAKIAE